MDKWLCTSKKRFLEADLNDLPADPAKRPKMIDYHPNDRDAIRRAYLQKGPHQPRKCDFPQKPTGSSGSLRRFNINWYYEFGSWLEYSNSEDSVYCLYCYLMRPQFGNQGAGDIFVSEGWSNWKDKARLGTHIGEVNSAHNKSYRQCLALMNRKQHVDVVIVRQSNMAKEEYRIQLNAVIDCLRFLLRQGLAFRGHNESESSSNRGNFLELLTFLGDHNEAIGRVLKQACGNLQLTSSDIQKDIISAAATETTKVIVSDIGDEFFSILVDESRDISIKEQMAIVLRYVDKKGCVIERFLNLTHVSDTSALLLKKSIESLFAKHGLSLSKIRGQGYDGASNMRGEFNGLKSLILRENESAFYVHCFAHQLQLALIAIAKDQIEIGSFFNLVTSLTNIVGASCKRRDILREKQLNKVIEALQKGEISSGRGLNQAIELKRPGDTRWGSHYGTLLNLIAMFSSVLDVLQIIEKDGINSDQRAKHMLY